MSRLTQENLARRLILGFGALILIFLLFGAFIFYDMHSAFDLNRTIYNHPLVVSNASLQANVSIAKMHRSMKDIVLFNSSSRILQFVEAVNEEEQQVYRQLDIVKKNILGEKGRDLEREARNLFDKWQPIRNEVIGLVNNDQRENAAHITIGKGANHAALLEEKMLGLTNYARDKASEFRNEAEKMHSRVHAKWIIFLFSGILASILVGFFTIRRIVSSEKKLRGSETKYRQIFDTNTAIKLIIDPDSGAIIEANNAACSYYGYSKKELMALNISDINVLSPEDIHSERQNAKTQKRLHFNFSHRLASGEERDVEVYSGPLVLGEKTKLYSIVHDVTDRKQAEKALQKNEAKYRLIAENMADIVTTMDMDLRFTYVSPSIMRLRGFTVEEAMKQTIDQIMTPDSFEIVASAFEEELRLEDAGTTDPDRTRILEVEEYKKDGSTIWVETKSSFIRDEDQKPIGILIVSRDITERRRGEIEIKNREQLLNEMGAIAKIGGWEHDLVTGETTWTRETYKIVEIESGPVPGPDEHLDYYPPKDRAVLDEAYRRAVETTGRGFGSGAGVYGSR